MGIWEKIKGIMGKDSDPEAVKEKLRKERESLETHREIAKQRRENEELKRQIRDEKLEALRNSSFIRMANNLSDRFSSFNEKRKSNNKQKPTINNINMGGRK